MTLALSIVKYFANSEDRVDELDISSPGGNMNEEFVGAGDGGGRGASGRDGEEGLVEGGVSVQRPLLSLIC
jgi:hypothetical protein